MGKICKQNTCNIRLKYYICWFILSLHLTFSYILVENFLKAVMTFGILILICNQLYKKNFITSIIISFTTLFINICSEIIYAISIILFAGIDMTYIKSNIFGDLLSNFLIVVVNFSIIRISFILNIIQKIVNNINLKIKTLPMLLIIFSLISLSLLLYYMYFEIPIIIGFILTLFLIITFCSITICFLSEKSNKEKIETEYRITLNRLSEYEKLYSYQRMLNHEFKNDLMVIRGMTKPTNKKLLRYIDEIVDFKNTKDEKWLNTLKRIPEGGLLGILYYKLLTMEKEKVSINFEIGRNFKAKDYNIIEEKLKSKICKLLGIYLDNSIQAVKNTNQKNVSILIDEEQEFFIFNIKNNFIGTIDLDNIYEEGYTTNGQGRGYGLAIAKDIFEQDNRIFQRTLISGNIFIQEIKIKI